MISYILLGVLALFIIVGLGKLVLKDFKMSGLIPTIFLAMVIGLNFIPTIHIGAFDFRVGTALFYIVTLALFFFYGRFATQMTALVIALILGGLGFAATVLSSLGPTVTMFNGSNFVYALIIGVLAVVLTRNGKYSFLVSVEAMMLLNLLVQVNTPTVSLDYGFDWTIVAAVTSVMLYALSARLAVKPSRASYYFEAGRLED